MHCLHSLRHIDILGPLELCILKVSVSTLWFQIRGHLRTSAGSNVSCRSLLGRLIQNGRREAIMILLTHTFKSRRSHLWLVSAVDLLALKASWLSFTSQATTPHQQPCSCWYWLNTQQSTGSYCIKFHWNWPFQRLLGKLGSKWHSQKFLVLPL